MHVAILGACGNAGSPISRLLAEAGSCDITLLGRDPARLGHLAGTIAAAGFRRPGTGVLESIDSVGLAPHLASVDLLLVASATIAHTRSIAETCVATGTDYFDINVSSKTKLAALNEVSNTAGGRYRCFITDGGVHPGLPGALVKIAEARIGPLKTAFVAGAFGIDFAGLQRGAETTAEFVSEVFEYDGSLLVEGRWVKGMRYARKFDLGGPFGNRQCLPYCMSEIRELTSTIPGLRDLGFYIAGFGAVVDYIFMPLCLAFAMVPGLKSPSGRLLAWSLARFARLQGAGGVLVLEAESNSGRFEMRVRHDDVYLMTAVPVVACLAQYLDDPNRPGLRTQSGFVEPVRFAADIERMGLQVEYSENP